MMSHAEPVNILLVDDQPGKLLSYEVILNQLGERLIKASSAREALAQLLRYDVAVVLIDVQMPELDGFELAAMIREHPRFEQTSLIFVSAIHLSEIDRIRGYEAGAVDYVPVPVVPEVLRAKVRVFVDLYRKTRELERLNAELEQRVVDRTAALEASRLDLQRLNDELEERIEERTREREQAMAQLFEAQKVDTIGQLTGGVAHDFNNLLMAILGSLQSLKKRIGEDPKSHRLIDNALQGAERGASLTQRLLAFARRQELRPEVVDLRDLISGMQDLLHRGLGPGVTLRHEISARLPKVVVDANQLELAILNLALNARDAMPEGGELTISATPSETATEGPGGLRPGSYVSIRVSDTGEGMDEETLARATEPFFTRKGVGKGTGLGLSMVHGMAGQSGGGMHIRSKVGVGTEVELWLPQSPHEFVQDVPVVELAQAPASKIRILLVDDDVLVSTGTAAILEDLGHEVVEVHSGIAALSLIGEDPHFDLVITDQAMPGMTGLELAAELRTSFPQLPVVLASGYADLANGSVDTLGVPRLSKPFRQSDISRLIAETCGALQPN
jgi:signal transduction histidine kinase